jgi:hypothetical protein
MKRLIATTWLLLEGTRFRLYRHEPGNLNSLPSDIVVTIYEDTHGTLWIGCIAGYRTLATTCRICIDSCKPMRPS